MAAALAPDQLYDVFVQGIIGIPDITTRAALHNQGLLGPDTYLQLEHEDIATICANIRKPGGTFPNPQAGFPGQPAMVPNPGVTIGFVQQRRLEQLRYYIHHLERIQRVFDVFQATRERVRGV
ncbi:hypothetical protein ACA910_007475 [Epithemia clementina (nom. ined.)]